MKDNEDIHNDGMYSGKKGRIRRAGRRKREDVAGIE
jgi:hypothetical protein